MSNPEETPEQAKAWRAGSEDGVKTIYTTRGLFVPIIENGTVIALAKTETYRDQIISDHAKAARTEAAEHAMNLLAGEIADLRDEERRLKTRIEAAEAATKDMNTFFSTQVQLCHDRDAMFNDPNIISRPPDWQAMTAELYALAAQGMQVKRAYFAAHPEARP